MNRSDTELTSACCVHRCLALASGAAQGLLRHPGGHTTGVSPGQGARGDCAKAKDLAAKKHPLSPPKGSDYHGGGSRLKPNVVAREGKRIQQLEPIFHEPPRSRALSSMHSRNLKKKVSLSRAMGGAAMWSPLLVEGSRFFFCFVFSPQCAQTSLFSMKW